MTLEQVLDVSVTWWLYHTVQTWLAVLSLVVATDGAFRALEDEPSPMALSASVTEFVAGALALIMTLVIM